MELPKRWTWPTVVLAIRELRWLPRDVADLIAGLYFVVRRPQVDAWVEGGRLCHAIIACDSGTWELSGDGLRQLLPVAADCVSCGLELNMVAVDNMQYDWPVGREGEIYKMDAKVVSIYQGYWNAVILTRAETQTAHFYDEDWNEKICEDVLGVRVMNGSTAAATRESVVWLGKGYSSPRVAGCCEFAIEMLSGRCMPPREQGKPTEHHLPHIHRCQDRYVLDKEIDCAAPEDVPLLIGALAVRCSRTCAIITTTRDVRVMAAGKVLYRLPY